MEGITGGLTDLCILCLDVARPTFASKVIKPRCQSNRPRSRSASIFAYSGSHFGVSDVTALVGRCLEAKVVARFFSSFAVSLLIVALRTRHGRQECQEH